jgi:hypothetical protein
MEVTSFGQEPLMNMQEVEGKIIELKHRDPFAPFVVDMNDGQSIEVPHPNLAIAITDAGFIDFKNVRAIRLINAAEIA